MIPGEKLEKELKEKRLLAIQTNKDEIESFMEKINEDIRNIDLEKIGTKEVSKNHIQSRRPTLDNTLAKSALKECTERKIIKLFNNPNGKPGYAIKKTLSPKILLRTSTIINFQV